MAMKTIVLITIYVDKGAYDVTREDDGDYNVFERKDNNNLKRNQIQIIITLSFSLKVIITLSTKHAKHQL